MFNSSIKRLQQLLNSDSDTQIAVSGAGSAGNETEYYGSLTRAAVRKFQMKYGVVSSASDAGYGYVGPNTRAKLQEVFSEAGSSQITPSTPTASVTVDELSAQIQAMLEQVQALQLELEAA